MKTTIPLVKGMREFYPEDLARRNYLGSLARRASEMFGYQEWDAPFIETIDLYAAKSGEELVEKQAFVFADRGGDKVTLRPELTPSLARMIAKRQNELIFPLRWWSYGPFWRYEQPQKGRTREFYQWNIDLLGVSTPEADAELIAIAATFLRLAGLTPAQACISINDRRLMDSQFDALKIPPGARADVSALVDRRSKMDAGKWDANAAEIGLSEAQLTGLKDLLANAELWRESVPLQRVFAALESLGVADYVRFDANVMRGLLYYTGTVFEAYDLSGSLRRAILGGGRYDNLLADVGGDPLPGVGFAMGDVVIGLLLEEKGLLPPFEFTPAPVLVTVFDAAGMPLALSLAAELRAGGLNVVMYPEAAKLQKQFKYADRIGARIALVMGPEEMEKAQVMVKNLRSGEQAAVARDALIASIRSLLETKSP